MSDEIGAEGGRDPFELAGTKWYDPVLLALIAIMVVIGAVFLRIREWFYGF